MLAVAPDPQRAAADESVLSHDKARAVGYEERGRIGDVLRRPSRLSRISSAASDVLIVGAGAAGLFAALNDFNFAMTRTSSLG
jgi:hypothetical protein